MSEAATPTGRTDRIAMLDTTRGIAVLGILLMNITSFGLPNAYDDPTNWGGSSGANLAAYRIMALFFEGTMRGLFTLLFGASALLFLQRHTTRDPGLRPADLYFRRTMWLIVFGMINGYVLLWDGDILFSYGVVGMFLFVFRNIPPRRLLIVAAIALSMQTVMFTLDRADFIASRDEAAAAEVQQAAGATLSAGQLQAIENFKEAREDYKPSPETLTATIAGMRSNYLGVLADVKDRTYFVETTFFIRYGFMECLGMMLLGMVLFRFGVLTGHASTRTFMMFAVVGYAIGLPINVFELIGVERGGFSTESILTSYLTYDAGRIPTTLGHVGVIGLLCHTTALAAMKRTLAAVGQMALSNYLTQSVLCMILFTGVGFALYGQLQRAELYYVVAAIWLVQLIWSPWWMRRYQFGPAEWLWRSLTYGKRQPMRLTPQPTPASLPIA
ncbi:MAG TPA: DUF418 domain-containing protein [Steroidobacteraceae bacterium]|jgi:uncharacterized protein